MNSDVEDGKIQVHHLKGYPSLAAFIASDKDKSTAIYRRFDRLSARNLLLLQSELVELEAQQDAFDEQDFHATTEEKGILSIWPVFNNKAAEPGNVRERERLDLAIVIREKLKEYREAVLLESTLFSIQPPTSRALAAFRNVFHNDSSPGGGFPTLGGRSAYLYDEKNDLMSLSRPKEEDRLTSLVRYSLPWLFVKRRTNSPLTYISERRLQIFVIFINILLTFALLFGAIYHLYSVSNDKTKLGLIAFYTVSFAVCLGLVTSARRPEVFGACAAYAAVLVVFVSGDIGSDSSKPNS